MRAVMLMFLFIPTCVNALAGQRKTPPSMISSIEIEHTHLPRESVLRLLGLQVGQSVDDEALLAACDRVSKTGLVSNINYSFKPAANSSGVIVVFTFWDETPLLPATVFPRENESAVWECLRGADPIFLKELPNTKGALRFYVANLNRCLAMTSDRPLHAEAKVKCDANLKPSGIEFRIEPGAANDGGPAPLPRPRH